MYLTLCSVTHLLCLLCFSASFSLPVYSLSFFVSRSLSLSSFHLFCLLSPSPSLCFLTPLHSPTPASPRSPGVIQLGALRGALPNPPGCSPKSQPHTPATWDPLTGQGAEKAQMRGRVLTSMWPHHPTLRPESSGRVPYRRRAGEGTRIFRHGHAQGEQPHGWAGRGRPGASPH